MATHRRSYHCFEAIWDDASRKPSHSGHLHRQPGPPQTPHQDPSLEDEAGGGGGSSECNVCQPTGGPVLDGATGGGDDHHLPPIDKHARLEGGATASKEQHFHFRAHSRNSKRLLLVKNSDPSVRRTIVLHRRAVRSLGLFMDEVAELMQCHVRKLCTTDGQKVIGWFLSHFCLRMNIAHTQTHVCTHARMLTHTQSCDWLR